MIAKRGKKRLARILQTVVLILGSMAMMFPFLWMVSTAFKPPPEIISYPPKLIPHMPTLEHFNELFSKLKFGRFFLNSAYIAILVTLSALFTSSLVGYVFAKFEFRGRNAIFLLILSSMMIPFPVVMIPLYLLMAKLKLVDTHVAVMLPSIYSTFGIFLMRQFIRTIPSQLIEAARIDGCSEFKIFWSIILPLCKPALAVLGVFTFMWNWDSFVWPLIVLQSEDKFTLPVGLAVFSQRWWTNYGLVMAGALVSVVPILIIFVIFQKHFVRGIVMTGFK